MLEAIRLGGSNPTALWRRTNRPIRIRHRGTEVTIPANTMLWLPIDGGPIDASLFPHAERFDTDNIRQLIRNQTSHGQAVSLLARNRYEINSFNMVNTRQKPAQMPRPPVLRQRTGADLTELYRLYKVCVTEADSTLAPLGSMPRPRRSETSSSLPGPPPCEPVRHGGALDEQYPSIRRMLDGMLRFKEEDGFSRARKLGAFHLEHPRGWDFSAGIALAQSYYLEPEVDADQRLPGFHRKDLGKSLLAIPAQVPTRTNCCRSSAACGGNIFPPRRRPALGNERPEPQCSLNCSRWSSRKDISDLIAGGMSSNQALQYCIFNHFRADSATRWGLTAPQGQRFYHPALHHGAWAGVAGKWLLDSFRSHARPFHPGTWTLLRTPNREVRPPVQASYHRVRRMEPQERKADRFTFGSYLGPRWDQDLYQISGETVKPVQSFPRVSETQSRGNGLRIPSQGGDGSSLSPYILRRRRQ